MTRAFADDLLEIYKKTKSKKYFPGESVVDSLLRHYLLNNSEHIEASLEDHFQKAKQIDERDIKFALDLARAANKKVAIGSRIFDIALTKKHTKCSTEYKALMMQHFSAREPAVFESYLKLALDPYNPLAVDGGVNNAKYLTKRILKSKIALKSHQAGYLITSLAKTKIKDEGQYLVYLKLLDYLGTLNSTGYDVFEQKFNELYSGDISYIFTTPDVIIKVLNSCSNAELKYKLARKFLVAPFANNKYIKKAVSRKIPELQKLLNFQ